MVLNKMETIRAPVNIWNKDSIRPGPVGSVGDALVGVRLRQSAPDMEMRWDKNFSLKNTVYSGSNVSDGYSAGFTTGGGVARTLSTRWPKRQGFKSAVGWIKEDVVPMDRSRTALMGSLGQYSWDAQVGQIARASSTGEMFKPLPEGYTIGQGVQPRGSQIPRIVAESTGDGIALPPTEQKIVDSVFGDNGSIKVPGGNACSPEEMQKVWVPAMDTDKRKVKLPALSDWRDGDYPYRDADSFHAYPHVGDNVSALEFYIFIDKFHIHEKRSRVVKINTSPCGAQWRPADEPFPRSETEIAKPGGWRDSKATKFMGSSYSQTTRIR
jgi:hypothetical protein